MRHGDNSELAQSKSCVSSAESFAVGELIGGFKKQNNKNNQFQKLSPFKSDKVTDDNYEDDFLRFLCAKTAGSGQWARGEGRGEGRGQARSGLSSGGWSRRSGAGPEGCWQRAEEPTRIRTSWKNNTVQTQSQEGGAGGRG